MDGTPRSWTIVLALGAALAGGEAVAKKKGVEVAESKSETTAACTAGAGSRLHAAKDSFDGLGGAVRAASGGPTARQRARPRASQTCEACPPRGALQAA